MMRSRRAVTIWMVYLDRPLVSSDGQWNPVSFIGLTPDAFHNGAQPWMMAGQPKLPDSAQPMTVGYAQGASCGAADDGTTICPPSPAIASVDIDEWPVRVCSAEATQQSAPSPAIAGSR